MIDTQEHRARHVAAIKRKAGPRYTPELNVELPISEIFDGIGRTERFYREIRAHHGKLLKEFRGMSSTFDDADVQEGYDAMRGTVKRLSNLLTRIKEYGVGEIPWSQIADEAKGIEEGAWTLAGRLRKAVERVKAEKTPPRKDDTYHHSPSERLNNDLHYIYEVRRAVGYFTSLASCPKAQLSNNPFLLLVGSAGTGKTHLLCDFVEHRMTGSVSVSPGLLVFGEYFSDEADFWEQAISQLEPGQDIQSKDALLSAMNDIGARAKTRAVLIIDALNENLPHAPDFWKTRLDGIVAEVKRFPHVALIVSVRSGFEPDVLTDEQRKLFIHEEHRGFEFREWEAVSKFFTAFSLSLPEIPLLMPEFQNPLFLLLFCKAFQRRKGETNKQVFRGHEGATYIFESFVLNAGRQVAEQFNINKGRSGSPAHRIWNAIIKEIANEMVRLNDDRVAEEALRDIIAKEFSDQDVGALVQGLESNMLIVRIPRYRDGEKQEGFDVRFPFQKFSDHLIARYIFKRYEDEFGKGHKTLHNARRFFSRRRKLGKLLAMPWNRGIVEALCVQFPEQFHGLEYFEAVPYVLGNAHTFYSLQEAFVASLIWRNPKAFSRNLKNTLRLINGYVIKTRGGHNQLLNAFLSIAPVPKHPLNAHFLHRHLLQFSMPERDSWWSTFLHYEHGNNGAVDRLLAWSWSDQDKKHVDDKAILLASTALSWFLTTSDRFVRDKATLGLACLLRDRLHLVTRLLRAFAEVDDIYVRERLFAVAYACALSSHEDRKGLGELAEWIYKNVFKEGTPPVHILLRDYARGVIETALRRDIDIEIDASHINPPYKSTWPRGIPTLEALKTKYYPEDFFQDRTEERGFLSIWSSVMGFGDFARYILGTNSWMPDWSARKLGSRQPNRKLMLQEFKGNLSTEQEELFGRATNPFHGIDLARILAPVSRLEIEDLPQPSDEERRESEEAEEGRRRRAMSEFEASLTSEQRALFRKQLKPHLNEHGAIDDPLERFDLKIAQRWIFQRIVKLGWDPKLHGEFDDSIARHDSGRSEHKPERIGKKYQWIAYHEFLALLSDHYEFRGDYGNDQPRSYKGPWEPHVRDIDPTLLFQSDDRFTEAAPLSRWLASDASYDAWANDKTDVDWLKTNDDLPAPEELISLADDNGKKWLMLEGMISWQDETPPEHERYTVPVRDLWVWIKSYIVKKKDAKGFWEWATKQDFYGRWMPESHDFYEVFIGEYPNSLAFEDLRGEYNVWTASRRIGDGMPVRVVVTDDGYLNEFTRDCSRSGSLTVKLPNKWLVNEMGLIHKHTDGRWFDKDGGLVATPTRVFDSEIPAALLMDRLALTTFLQKGGYGIVWTVLGEKRMIGGSLSGREFIGELNISGAYTLDARGRIKGDFHSRFRAPHE